MALLFRGLVLLALLCAAISFAFYAGTGNPKFKRLGSRIFRVTILALLLFFAVLVVERLR